MDNEQKMNQMMKKKVWAVIGATPNPDKTSNHIYHTFLDNGYEAYAVNPKYDQMDDGRKCYASLEALPVKPDCVDFVVPPQVTLDHLKNMDPQVYPDIWLQPGTFNAEVVQFAEEKGFNVVHEGACTMAFLRTYGCAL